MKSRPTIRCAMFGVALVGLSLGLSINGVRWWNLSCQYQVLSIKYGWFERNWAAAAARFTNAARGNRASADKDGALAADPALGLDASTRRAAAANVYRARVPGFEQRAAHALERSREHRAFKEKYRRGV